MHPILFSLGTVPVHSYYVLWTGALMLAVFWTKRRLLGPFGVKESQAVSVLFWALLGMYVGARLGAVYDQWEYFSAHPWRIISPWEGGLSAVTAFLGAGVTGMWRCRQLRIPLWVVADAASLPAAVTETVGRWGCFLNGCCYGVETSCPVGVHFPFDDHAIFRHPTQLYYVAGGLILLTMLFFVERWIGQGKERRIRGAVLWPLFMVGFGLLRWAVDPLRHENVPQIHAMGFLLTGAVVLGGVLWLGATWKSYRKDSAVSRET